MTGDMLRLPFPAFAIAFTDRYALGLLERLISRSAERPERRGLLRVVTVYVLESAQRLGRPNLGPQPSGSRSSRAIPRVDGWRMGWWSGGMPMHKFFGTIRRLFLPQMKLEGQFEFPDPTPPPAAVSAILTSLKDAISIESFMTLAVEKSLDQNQFAVVSYKFREANQSDTERFQTIHFGPGQAIPRQLNNSAHPDQNIVAYSGYIITLK